MKKNIALVAGGFSRETEVSLRSARGVMNHLDTRLFDIYKIIIEKELWYYSDDQRRIPVDVSDFSIDLNGRKVIFDCVFLVIHGTPGEDGKLQGYFDLLGIPYTSAGVASSAITFNKAYSNRMAKALGMLTAETWYIPDAQKAEAGEIIPKIKFPCYVKPNRGGSSIGITRVQDKEKLLEAIQTAASEDENHEVVIDREIRGTEITCGMLKYKNEIIQFPLTEIISRNEFFDFQAKYDDNLNEEITPARIPDDAAHECTRISSFIYNELNLRGLVRIDYILSGGKIYFLEVNTIPGLTEESIVPKQIKTAGYSLKDIYTMMIEDALFWKESKV